MVHAPRFLLSAILIPTALAACSSPEPATPVQSPYAPDLVEGAQLEQNLTRRMLNPIMGEPEKLKRAGIPNIRDLEMSATAIPAEFSRSATKQIDIALAIRNDGKKAVNLWFPSTQRIELIVKNKAGDVLKRWSDGEKFKKETGYLVVNPDETITYAETISTSFMPTGQVAVIEAFIAGYPDLRARVEVIPAP